MARLPRLDVAGQTDVGLKRKRNEDFYKILIPPGNMSQSTWGALFVVADGMGGMGGGDVASRAAVEELIRRYYDASNATSDDHFAQLNASLEYANAFVRKQATQMALQRIGTTAAGILLTPLGEAIAFNVGDSRVYRVRSGVIEQLSRDQSIVAQQLASGLISEEEAKNSDNPNLTSFLGQPFAITPAYSRTPTQPDDIFVMCSDGLWREVSDEEIRDIVQGANARSVVQTLVQLARERGAPDNLTVIVARIHSGTQPSAPRFFLPVAVVGILVLVIAAILFAVNNSASRSSALVLSASPTIHQQPTITSQSAETDIPLLAVIASSTATKTASPAPSSTLTTTATPTITPSSTSTHTATITSTNTFTPAATDTATPTLRPTRTLTPTLTLSPAPSFTPILTVEPTVTLDPTLAVLAGTPQLTPTVAFNLILESARQPEGVVLTRKAILYPDAGIREVSGYLLNSGDAVQIIGDSVVVGEGNTAQIWWHVQAVGTKRNGWLPQKGLESALLISPDVLPESLTLPAESPETTDVP
jgi:PPM family protein phosphatase